MLGKTHRLGGIMVGALTPVVLERVLNIQVDNIALFTTVTMAGGAIGSLLPDLDSPNSIISKKLRPVSKAVREFAHHRGITHTLLGWIIFGIISVVMSYISINFLDKTTSYYERGVMGIVCGVIISSSMAFIANSINKYTHIIKKREIRKLSIAGFLFGFILVLTFNKVVLAWVPVYLLGMTLGYGVHIFYDMFTISGVPFFYPFTKESFRFAKFRTGGIIEIIASSISIVIIVIALCSLFNYKII